MTGGGTEGVVGGEEDGGGAVVEEFEEGGVKIGKGGTKLIITLPIRIKNAIDFLLLSIHSFDLLSSQPAQKKIKSKMISPSFEPEL